MSNLFDSSYSELAGLPTRDKPKPPWQCQAEGCNGSHRKGSEFRGPDGLTFPASLAFGTGKGERSSVFVTNLAFDPYPPFLAGPGLTKIDVGQPGMPLP